VTAGFFSKEEILAAALDGRHLAVLGLLLAGAFLTTFYTFRLIYLAFFTGPRMSKDAARHVHESPAVMTVPLIVLALLTIGTGWLIGIRSPSTGTTPLARFLEPVFPIHEGGHGGLLLLALSFVVVAAGFSLAVYLYKLSVIREEMISQPRTPLHALLLNAYYVDWLYDRAIVRPIYRLSQFCARVIDLGVIDGLVNLVGRAVVGWAAAFRQLQTGYIVNYALTMLVGAVAVVAFLLVR
jgi:NADH-quinone oxidoreductase subunit L